MRISRIRGLLCLLIHAFLVALAQGAFVGFNYGMQLSSPPQPQQVASLLQAQHIGNLRLYDANASILAALAGTGVEVVVTVPNGELLSVGESNATAANWVKANVLSHLPDTNITGVCVGTQVLTSIPNAALVLLPAIRFIHSALVAANLDRQIKVTTSHSSDLILDSFPPSQAFFNHTWDSLMQPLLQFLSATGSYFMLDIHSYDIYKANKGVILLDYALLNPLAPSDEVVDSNTLLSYSNLFDAVLDSAFFAMARLNYSNISIVVSETGWPSRGDSSSSSSNSDSDATADNAAAYNSNLIRHVINGTGTPKRGPPAAPSAYILSLFDEDLKAGPTTAKSYGLFNASNMRPVYLLHLSGSGPLLSNDTTKELYCVAKPGSDTDQLQIALDWACGPGRANCSAIQPGDLCYEPDTVESHASFAFNSYFQMMGQDEASCIFDGMAIITTTDPSYASCIFTVSLNVSTTNTSSLNTTLTNTTSNGNLTSAPSPAFASETVRVHILFTFLSLFLVLGVVSRL